MLRCWASFFVEVEVLVFMFGAVSLSECVAEVVEGGGV